MKNDEMQDATSLAARLARRETLAHGDQVLIARGLLHAADRCKQLQAANEAWERRYHSLVSKMQDVLCES